MKKARGKGKGSRRKARGGGEQAGDQEREHLRRELGLAEGNAKRQRIAWREAMLRLERPQIRERLEDAWRSFDRALDDRDFSVSILLDELRLCDEQKMRAQVTHTEQIDRLLEVYRQHLDERESHYQASIKEALGSAGQQVSRLEADHEEQQLFLRGLVFSTNLKYQQLAERLNTNNLSKLDGLKEENDNVLRMASAILKRRLRNHSEELADVLREHEQNTRDRRKDFESLRLKDDDDQKIIRRNSLRIEKLYDTLRLLKANIADYCLKAQKQIEDCTFERDYFRAAYLTIQNRVLSDQSSDRERLKCIVTEYNKTENHLKRCLTKVEQILSVEILCQKYETYNEELQRYPLSTAFEDIWPCGKPAESDNNQIQVFEEKFLLKKLLQVVSKVNKDVTNWKLLIKDLIQESIQLKCSLKMYMEEVSRPHSTEKKDNIAISPVIIDIKNVLFS